MSAKPDPVDPVTLRDLVPLNTLSEERLQEVAALATPERLPAGETVFRTGEADHQTVFLVFGEVELTGSDGASRTVWHGMEEARHPLADHQPRDATAVTVTDVHLLRIDNSMLDYVVAWDQIAALHTRPPEPARAPAGSVKKIFEALPLKHVPPANVRALVDRVESVPVRAGETVVNQGEEGDYYYFIDEGRAEVSRQVRLAELEAGAAFGEEALVCRGRRNASVTMLTDGRLLRVSKEDFDRLLQGPLLNWIGGEEARAVVNSGARWLDVRHTREFNHTHLPKAINLPLDELREGMGVLDRKMHYICYCQTGQRSSAAAFLLKQQGYSVSVLKGGLRALPLVRRAT